ncbi:MAG: hypothetical protein M3R48_03815 [Candidatus Dormibacteraeota bacterium]|nr:hypothetical protein [Candidatus Dormibacteraeota bacterium]
MGSCSCAPPTRLHITPEGVHGPDGRPTNLEVVDESWWDTTPRCSVCATPIETTFYRCRRCDATLCRGCVALDTLVVECDCEPEVMVTGVQLAARRAAGQLAR